MITVPVNVYNTGFLWHLNLFWHAHNNVYGDLALHKVYSAVINQDDIESDFDLGVLLRHKICQPWQQYADLVEKLKDVNPGLCVPLNIQVGLQQIIDDFEDFQVIELVDHDMLHFRKHHNYFVNDNEFMVCDLYEKWHLHSLTTNKSIVDHVLDNNNQAQFYNGGFVPIIGTAYTFKKILADWIDMHIKILVKQPTESNNICWWAGMYSFNAACEKHGIHMIPRNFCYVPGINELSDEMYIAHYSVDPRFDKKKYPNLDLSLFLDNDFYNLVKSWPNLLKTTSQ